MKEESINVVGLGDVGLPLCLQFARSCVNVTGSDVNAVKVECCNRGKSYIKHIADEVMPEVAAGGLFRATTNFAAVREAAAALICVPRPLDQHGSSSPTS
jgi:UDP-N-acetyl-D-glucosamine dehydrogenase